MANRLENIKEEGVENWLPAACPLPHTPTESMEFLGRSWSVSSVEVSKALSHTYVENPNSFCNADGHQESSSTGEHQPQPLTKPDSPSVSPRKSDEMKPLMLIVPDIEHVYTPLQTDVIVQLSECRQHLELLLESIPTMYQNNKTADSAFGAGMNPLNR